MPWPIRHGQLFDCRSFRPLEICFLVSVKSFLEAVPHVLADAPNSRSLFPSLTVSSCHGLLSYARSPVPSAILKTWGLA